MESHNDTISRKHKSGLREIKTSTSTKESLPCGHQWRPLLHPLSECDFS